MQLVSLLRTIVVYVNWFSVTVTFYLLRAFGLMRMRQQAALNKFKNVLIPS